jgi:hypothetical protein
MDRQLLINNSVGASKAAVTYSLPIVHSTVNVKTGVQAAYPAEGAEGDLVFIHGGQCLGVGRGLLP